MKFTQDVAVVTGSTSGIGAAVAERLAKNGARVIISGRIAERGQIVVDKLRSSGADASFVACDVANASSVEELAFRTAEIYGDPTILVNAAGILQSGKHVLDQDEFEHRTLWETNYNGTFLSCQVFGRLMRSKKSGCIVNIGSLASLAPLSLPAYTPGKAAVWSLTQILAAELGPFGIRVNAVAPGYTLSDGLKQKIATGLRNPNEILKSTALGEFVLPEDVANAVMFLCSGQARMITGVILPVDAGWLIQAPYGSYLKGNPIVG